MKAGIYLDHNASSPIRPEAAAAVMNALQVTGNPSSVHTAGRNARAVIEDAREAVASLLNAKRQQVVFTSGATEANNLALRGCGADRILVSAIEHDSILHAADVEKIPVTPDGILDLDALETMLAKGQGEAPRTLVSVMSVNNETGVIQPVGKAADIARRFGAMVHTDAVQAVGKIPLDFSDLDVDMLSFSAHKLGGPRGVGVLLVKPSIELEPVNRGGGQEGRRRGGTENVSGIAGLGAAISVAGREDNALLRLEEMRLQMERRLQEELSGSIVLGQGAPRIATTTCFALPGIEASKQVMALDLLGFDVSAGAACSSGKVHASHVVSAMGYGDDIASSAIRISLGWSTTPEEVSSFTQAYIGWARKLCGGN